MSQFIIIEAKPVVLDRDAQAAAEELRTQLEEARSDAFLASLAREGRHERRKPAKVPLATAG